MHSLRLSDLALPLPFKLWTLIHILVYVEAEKLAYYVTPPLSPTASRAPNLVIHLDKPSQTGMEGGDPRRQYEQANYQPARGYGASIPSSGITERYGQPQAQAQQLPTPNARASAGSHASGLYPYTQGQQQYAPQMQDTSLQYQSDFPQDTQRQQHFPSYSSSMMYNISAQVHQPQQSPSFESVQQYQPRQSAAIEVLSNQFGVPQYYNAGEPTSASTQIPHTYSTTQYQQQPPFQQNLSGHRSSESTYSAGVGDYQQPLTMSNVPDQPESAQEGSAMEETFKYYTNLLKETYQCTNEGKLVEAGSKLLDLSKWLLGNVAALGRPCLIIQSSFGLFFSNIR